MWAEEVERDEDANQIIVSAPFESFGGLQAKLEVDGHEIVESGLERVPTTTKALNQEQTEAVEALIERWKAMTTSRPSSTMEPAVAG